MFFILYSFSSKFPSISLTLCSSDESRRQDLAPKNIRANVVCVLGARGANTDSRGCVCVCVSE